MNNEFKKINESNITRYVLEDGGATSGGTSAGSIASVSKPLGGVQRRAGDNLISQENKKSYKISHKPKNPVAKAHQTVGTGSGQHKDKTKVLPRQEKHKKSADMTMENFNAEYDDEAGMSYGSLHTINRAATGLLDTIKEGDDLPEWCQEKISLAEDYLVTVWDYLQSEKEQGVAEGNRGYAHGFASPTAPQLGQKRRDSDSGDSEPEGMFMVMIDGRPWKEFTSNMAFDRAKAFATKNPDRKVQVRWPSGQLNTVKEDNYMESLNAKLAEKLDPNAEPEVWVQDFQKANPNKYHQFKNKTPQKKAQMAVAARRDARLKK